MASSETSSSEMGSSETSSLETSPSQIFHQKCKNSQEGSFCLKFKFVDKLWETFFGIKSIKICAEF